MDTVAHKNIINKWDGKLIIDELREFSDSRGSLIETWRSDDSVFPEATMSYWSYTNQYVVRGPHLHVKQTDGFVTMKTKMLYQFHFETESCFFFTDPTKIYRLIVKPGVIHAYRNIADRESLTGNFPTSLFMGVDKTGPIDEVRYEHILENKPVYIILGAGGRLGKALTKTLLEESGFYDYNVIPVYEKFNTVLDLDTCLAKLFTPECFTSKDIRVINCFAYTNVQDQSDRHHISNCVIPTHLSRLSKKYNFDLYQISTDYIYQESKATGFHLSPYTRSKKDLENVINFEKNPRVHLIRVSNLFSLEDTDTHNIISKLSASIKENKEISYDPACKIYPTDVGVLSKKLSELVKLPSLESQVNIISNGMTIKDICVGFAYDNLLIKVNSLTNNHTLLFTQASVRKEVIDCSSQISEKIAKLT